MEETLLRSYVFGRLAAVVAVCGFGSQLLVGQTSINASPSALTFTPAGGSTPQVVAISLSTGQAAVPFTVNTTPGITAVLACGTQCEVTESPGLLPNRLLVTVNTSVLTAGSTGNIFITVPDYPSIPARVIAV